MAIIDLSLRDNNGNRPQKYASTRATQYTHATLANCVAFNMPDDGNKLYIDFPAVTSCTLKVQEKGLTQTVGSASVVATWVNLTDIFGNTSPISAFTGGVQKIFLTSFGASVRVCASSQRTNITVGVSL